ncbi:hypothetical protein MBANPS3_010160, partial [Mucor bainieri]
MSTASRLPNEILKRIFSYVRSSSTDSLSKQFAMYQLVCKGWSSEAQRALYAEIGLGARVESLIHTLETVPQITNCVKKLTFLPSFSLVQRPHVLLQAIFKYCSSIEEVHTVKSGRRVVWPHIMTLENQPNLKSIISQEDWDYNDTLYSLVTIKYKNTLTQLHLTGANYDNNHHNCSLLFLHLDSFSSLKQLYLDKLLFSSLDDLEQLFSTLPPNLHEIHFQGSIFAIRDAVPLQLSAQPNAVTIKKMTMRQTDAWKPALEYFALRFTALESFDFEGDLRNDTDNKKWIEQLFVFASTKRCIIKLRFRDHQAFYWNDILKYWTTFDKIDVNCTDKRLTILSPWDRNYSLSVTNTAHLFNLKFTMPPNFFALSATEPLSSFLRHSANFNSISIVFRRSMKDLYEKNSSKENMKAAIIALCKNDVDYWKIINAAINNLETTRRSTLHLESLVLFDNSDTSTVIQKEGSLSSLSLQGCILDQQALPALSLRLPETIDQLKLKSFRILPDDPFTLKVFFPHSTIHTLTLAIVPFYYTLQYSSQLTWADMMGIGLEDVDLLNAVSARGEYVLKVQTEDKTYLSQYRAHEVIENNCADPITETSSAFLIWIKCKKLNEVRIRASGWLGVFRP